ncbi:hypothetical protein ACO0K7_10545 [Undibacterium sp. Ji67W]|uniref:hypothetical protein n=1 Tax=Undibacterium sp. Ji67W TaxID=3413042 RepID=UPI003BF07A96
MKQKKNSNNEQGRYFQELDSLSANEMMEEDWDEYLDADTHEEYTVRDYQIGYWDMGEYGEQIVRATCEELAEDSFLCEYQPKRKCQPYIARCETLAEVADRIASGDNSLPTDGQIWRFDDAGNMYYEAMCH